MKIILLVAFSIVLFFSSFQYAFAQVIPIDIEIQLQDAILYENNPATFQVVFKNPSDKVILVEYSGSLTSLPPEQSYEKFSGEFALQPYGEQPTPITTMRLWDGSWRLFIQADGNFTTLGDTGIRQAAATGKAEYPFKVFSFGELIGIIALAATIIGVPPSYLFIRRRHRQPSTDSTIPSVASSAVPRKTKNEIMWEPTYREHSRVIGNAIFHGWNMSSGILTRCEYRDGRLQRREPRERNTGEVPLITHARKHLEIGLPDVLELAKTAQEESVGICNQIEEVVKSYESRITEEITKACPNLPLRDSFDHEQPRFCYKRNVFTAILEEAETRSRSERRQSPEIVEINTEIVQPNGSKKYQKVFDLRFSRFDLARGDKGELTMLQKTIDSLMSDPEIQGMITEYGALQKALQNSEKANALHSRVLSIAQDSNHRPIEGEGACDICKRLFDDILG